MVANIIEPRVRETSTTTGTGNIVLAGAMRGSLTFDEVMAVNDTCDICISYDNSFEECSATLLDAVTLQRGTVYRSRHANGTVDQNHVSFAAGVKTVVMTFGSGRLTTFFAKAVLVDRVQSFTTGEKRQALDNLGLFPTGTEMIFHQTAAPAGWTKSTTHNDKAMRLVSGSVGTGGSSAFSTVFGKTATDGHTLDSTEIPAHNHVVNISDPGHFHAYDKAVGGGIEWGPGDVVASLGLDATTSTSTTTKTTGITATSNLTGDGGPHDHPMDIRVQYVDMIIAVKD